MKPVSEVALLPPPAHQQQHPTDPRPGLTLLFVGDLDVWVHDDMIHECETSVDY